MKRKNASGGGEAGSAAGPVRSTKKKKRAPTFRRGKFTQGRDTYVGAFVLATTREALVSAARARGESMQTVIAETLEKEFGK